MRLKVFILITSILLLSGCIPKTKRVQTFNIYVQSSAKASIQKPYTLKIDYPSALNNFGGMHIFYNDNGRSGYYLFSRWSSSFNRIVYANIFRNLQSSKKFRYLVGYTSKAKAQRELEVTVVECKHIIKGESSTAKVAFDVRLLNGESAEVVKQKQFNYTVALDAKNAVSFTSGVQKATKRFIDELIEFL